MFLTTLTAALSLVLPALVAQEPAHVLDALEDKELLLVSFTLDGQKVEWPAGGKATLRVDGSRVGGQAFLNRYFGSFERQGTNGIQWPKPGFAATMMAGPQELMDAEGKFLQGLAATTEVRSERDGVVFTTADGTTALTFAAPARPLRAGLNGTHKLVSIVSEGQAIPLPAGVTITIHFHRAEMAAGFSGVNRFFGAYRATGERQFEWASSGFATTRMAGPADRMEFEATFLASLSKTAVWDGRDGKLLLESKDGGTRLEFELQPR